MLIIIATNIIEKDKTRGDKMSEQIKTVVAMLQKEINALREQIEKLNKENKHLKLENRRLKARCKANIYGEW